MKTRATYSLLLALLSMTIPGMLMAQTNLDGPVTVTGGWPQVIIFDGGAFQKSTDAILWSRNNFRILLDSDANQGGATFALYDNVSSSSGATPTVRLDLASGKSWLSLGGNLGIGTTNPQSKLAVDGTITTKEVVVTQDPGVWPDFVFEDDYELMPLDELEARIMIDGHLPGIPSADEAGQEGVFVGLMQAKLLEKVEELTLYMIELKKANDELRSRLETLARSE